MTMMKHLVHSIWIALLFLHCTEGLCSGKNDTAAGVVALHSALIKEAIVKPGAFNEQVEIYVFFTPTYLQQLNTAQQIFSIVGTMQFGWDDQCNTWNPADYGGVDEVALPADKVWKPEFGVLNSAVSNVFDDSSKNKYKVFTQNDGNTLWVVSETFTTTCKIDPVHFPFDTQRCNITIAGWSSYRHEKYIAFEIRNILFENSSEWQLLDSYVSNVVGPFPRASFTFMFKRRPDFYIIAMITPLIILSILGLLTFPLPPDSGEKIALGMACFLSFVVIQTSVTQYLPSSYSTMPYIVQIIFALMVFNALSISVTVITISVLLRKPPPRMPGWLYKLVNTSSNVNVQKTANSIPNEMARPKTQAEDEDGIHELERYTADTKHCPRCLDDQEEEQLDEKWKKVANFTNKLLFVLFSVALIILLATIFAYWKV